MDLLTKQRVFSEAVNGNRATLINYILTLIDRHQNMANGSGTIFKIANRVLIATAAHVIPSNPSGRIWPAVRDVRHDRDGFPGYSSIGRHPSYDVGYLEVHPDGVETYFGDREFGTLNQIAIRGYGRENKGVILVGSPAEHAQITQLDETTMEYKANIMTYWTVPLLTNECPVLSAGSDPADENVDIFLNYPNDDTITADGYNPIELPHPGGMSGGGIWDQEFNQGQLWDPSSIKIIGIQSRWDPVSRYLRGIQIIHWLHLIYRDFPDLQQPLREHFGDRAAWEIGI